MHEGGDARVRLVRDAELEEVARVWHRTRKQAHLAMRIAAERGVTLDDSRRVFREAIAPRCEIWVAEQQERIVGFLAIDGSTIDRMYVLPEAQHLGIGSRLLEKARERSPAGLELYTHQANRPARAFYERHGFRPVRFGTSPPPENEPDVEYHWRPA